MSAQEPICCVCGHIIAPEVLLWDEKRVWHAVCWDDARRNAALRPTALTVVKQQLAPLEHHLPAGQIDIIARRIVAALKETP